MVITENSNFTAEKEVVQTFKNGLNTCESNFNGTIKSLHSDMTSITFSTFSDIVGQTIKGRVDYLKDNDFKVIETDFAGGSFNAMQKNTDALLNELQVCINSKAKIESAEQEMKNAEYYDTVQVELPNGKKKDEKVLKRRQPAYNDAKAKKEEGEREFANGIKYANEYIKEYANIHFLGTHGNSNPQTQAQEAPTTSKRDEVAENFDYDFLREHMYMIFDPGLGQYVPITYGDTTIYLVKMGNDSYALCATVDTSTTPTTGTPINDVRFTHAQVSPQTENYNGFQHTYPEVEAACVDYFSGEA